uniref:Xrn1 N-terminal domain-containing protein n=1 Tax=viral metagenome TaxID=1070528 RepID=A0A6C0HCA4_9ZZZZ
MGIPSYFSYIVKNHIEIIRKYVKASLTVHNLYMDCNSIIYDAVRRIDFNDLSESESIIIIRSVIAKIEEYIDLISPSKNILVAFDGVAPAAKLEQQRSRRYKSWYQNEISKSIFKKTSADPWNTTAITPGTLFMKELNETVQKHFKNNPKYSGLNFIVSTSDHFGEGEHKIFDYIRSNKENHYCDTTVIYGLDADLIMLSINHLPMNPNIYLFRETPEFIKSIDSSLEPNETYLMDIPELTRIITLDMNNGAELTTEEQKNRIYDYIFLCFFLGNDFMPHFPAVNIRTGGVDKMLNAYKATIGGTKENLTDGRNIIWKNVRKLVAFLAENEETMFKTEMKLRDRNEKRFYPTGTPEEKYKKFDAIPTYDRDLEKYINPFKENWQFRYYKSLFGIENDEERIKQISVNYLEGLEWTMKYYTTGCPDWRWCYNYNYPPLLCDLIRHIPYFDAEFVPFKSPSPVTPLVQLCYVLPRQSLQFLPPKLYNALKKQHPDWYPADCDFVWAYCRYFWEAHVELPHLDIVELDSFVNATMSIK